MADKRIIDLTALITQATTDLYETSASGASSFKETRAQMLAYTAAHIAGSPYVIGDTFYANSTSTIGKIAGNVTTVKQYFSQTGTGTASSAPGWSTISGSDIIGSALTVSNDANITLTLGGTPATALLRAFSITAGWTGLLSIARGGTNNNTMASNGINYFDGTSITTDSQFTYDKLLGAVSLNTIAPAPSITVATSLVGPSSAAYFNVSRADTTNGICGVNFYTLSLGSVWFFGMSSAANGFTSNPNDLVLRANVGAGGAANVLLFDQLTADVTVQTGNLIVRDTSKSAQIFSLTTNSLVASDSSQKLVSLSQGTSGQVLTSAGAGAIPTWVFPVVRSWDGSTTPVDVTAGSGIDITGGVISLDGSGASAAYGYSAVQNLSTVTSFTDTTTWKPLVGTILSSSVNNFVASNNTPGDPTTAFYLQYTGTEPGVVQVSAAFSMRRFSSTTANGYYLTVSLDGINPISGTFGDRQLSYGLDGQGTNNSKSICYDVQLSLTTNQKIYFLVQNGTTGSTTTDNDFLNTQCVVTVQKVGDVGGAAAGVTSLNGLTGNVNITSSDNSVSISAGGSNVSLSVNQFQVVSGTSQALAQNQSYLCTNGSLTTLSLPTTCAQGSLIRVAGSGSGLFTITQSSGQSIVLGTATTTTGATGHMDVTASNNNSCVTLLCTVANTAFMAFTSQGNFTLV